ncbi:MAG TPA: baseplate J/gp47 family protein [Ktedonobacteraceae bacterium]|nr:baseplate J/gp47 family protein [Ktedonobacteraceae bacterium]
MHVARDEEQLETVHLFVVPENELPPKPDYAGTAIAVVCSLVLVGIIGLILFSPKTQPQVSFTTTIAGYYLAPVSKSTTLTVHATGKGHIAATYATGRITFYNGQTYTQIIPVGTVLTGADGVEVITDTLAVIPPAAVTFPPTYGQVSVPAHALVAGVRGNIQSGDINEACCVTSVIVQNPFPFTGGMNARDFTYLTSQDVSYAVSDNVQTLELQTQALFTTKIVLEPACKTIHTVRPAIGSETQTVRLTLKSVCTAISYSRALAKNRIEEAGKQFGQLSNIQFSVVGINRKGVPRLTIYVTAVVKPIVRVGIK